MTIENLVRVVVTIVGLGVTGAASADPGVSATEVMLGQSAVYSGASAGLGVEMWRGMEAALRDINAAGGVNGRKLQLNVCDDGYDPQKAADCTVNLVQKQNVFMLINSIGTPTIVKIIPFLHAWSKDNVLLFGNFTGAQPQRTMPYAPYVFNVRASYHQETAAHVRACTANGAKKLGTYVQNDAFGKDGEEGVRLALADKGGAIGASTYYERGHAYDTDVAQQVKSMRDAGVDCVSTTGSYQGIGAFIRTARAQGWMVPIFGVSFTGADQLLALLKKTGGKALDGVVITQVVPHHNDTSMAVVKQYRDSMAKHKLKLPPAPHDKGGYIPESDYSFGSLEGYINTKLYAEIVKKAGADLTRAKFKATAEGLKNFDIGLGAKNMVSFGPVTGASDRYNHQALNAVWFTAIKGGAWASLGEGQLPTYLAGK
jgi:branched-chain amino acid transport system substrate-binding protein